MEEFYSCLHWGPWVLVSAYNCHHTLMCTILPLPIEYKYETQTTGDSWRWSSCYVLWIFGPLSKDKFRLLFPYIPLRCTVLSWTVRIFIGAQNRLSGFIVLKSWFLLINSLPNLLVIYYYVSIICVHVILLTFLLIFYGDPKTVWERSF